MTNQIKIKRRSYTEKSQHESTDLYGNQGEDYGETLRNQTDDQIYKKKRFDSLSE